MNKEILELIIKIGEDITKYKYVGYFNLTFTYFKYDLLIYKDDLYLVLKSVMAIIPNDDRINYVKIPKTEEELNKVIEYYGYESVKN